MKKITAILAAIAIALFVTTPAKAHQSELQTLVAKLNDDATALSDAAHDESRSFTDEAVILAADGARLAALMQDANTFIRDEILDHQIDLRQFGYHLIALGSAMMASGDTGRATIAATADDILRDTAWAKY
jgi:hypothetical protein